MLDKEAKAVQWSKEFFFQHMVLEQLDTHIQKIKQDTHLTPSIKVDSKWMIKLKTIKLVQDNIGENLDDCEFVDYFLFMTPKPWSMKGGNKKLDFIKLKNPALQMTLSIEWEGMRRYATDGKKIFARDTYNK